MQSTLLVEGTDDVGLEGKGAFAWDGLSGVFAQLITYAHWAVHVWYQQYFSEGVLCFTRAQEKKSTFSNPFALSPWTESP